MTVAVVYSPKERPLTRVGVIGDIHAEHAHLEKALAVLEERRLDLIVATGAGLAAFR